MAGKISCRRRFRGSTEKTKKIWEEEMSPSMYPPIRQPLEPVDQNYYTQRCYPFATANAFLGPAFNACLDAHADVDPALLRYSRLPLPIPDRMAVATPDPTRSPPALVRHRPSPLLLPTGNGQSVHPPFHRHFSGTPPISPGSLCCRPLPTPVKRTIAEKMQEDDVLVIEGVVVASSAYTGSWLRSSFGDTGSSSSPSSSSSSLLYKTEMCRSWEETGSCRYGTRCQFAHGREELRPPPSRNKPEVSRPRVDTEGTRRETMPSEVEKQIMPETAEFEVMINAFIKPVDDAAACNKRRLPVFVALTNS